MRQWINLLEGVELSDEDFARFSKYRLSREDAECYCRLGKSVEGGLEMVERERIRGVLNRAEERAQQTLVDALPRLHTSSGLISYRSACALIANDDDLFDMVCGWTQNSDYAEDQPELAAKFLSVLKRLKPIKKRLYRGQQPYGENGKHTRGFHSWSENLHTAEDFAEKTGNVLVTDGPLLGLGLVDIITWRMRLRDGESHYAGPQAEWFVVDTPRCRKMR